MAKKIILTIIFLAALGTLAFWFYESRQDDTDATEEVVMTAAVYNQTQNADGLTVDARPDDVLVYTLTAQNLSDEVVPGFVVETNIGDVSELANLTDASGGNYNAGTSSLMWTPLDIPAQNSITRQFTVRVKDSLPAGTDMVMSLAYGNDTQVTVSAAAPAPTPTPVPTTNGSSYEAPTTGPSLWFAVILGLAFTAGVLLYRTARRINA